LIPTPEERRALEILSEAKKLAQEFRALKRAVSENANSLGLKNPDWE